MILVTGSAGHLGEAILRLGRTRGLAMRGLDLAASDFTDVTGDIADPAVLAHAMQGVTGVIHTATLHKPHVATHSQAAFVRTNIAGTLALLQAAASAGAAAFVFTSTTSAFGAALRPPPGAPAVWIDEDVIPVPKNIYGATKTGAEDLCHLYANRHGLPCVVLRTARFFPEPDDDPAMRAAFPDANAKVNEFLHRRLDLEDAAEAHLLALARAPALGFGRYVLSATTPFSRADLPLLHRDAGAVIAGLFPNAPALYARQGWRLPGQIGRVYDNSRARAALGWRPRHGFASLLDQVARGQPPGSALARAVGTKGYHGQDYADGLYPTQP